MTVYINAEFPFAVKLNGIFINAEKSFCVKNTDIVEVCPLIDVPARTFVFDENFIKYAEKGVIKVDLKGGYFIKLLKPDVSPFCILTQEKFSFGTVTVYKENGVKVLIETPNDFFLYVSTCEEVSVKESFINGYTFLFLSEKENLTVFTVRPKIKKVFESAFSSFEINGDLIINTELNDIAKHKISATFSFDGNSFVKNSAVLSKKTDFSYEDLPDKLLPFAFCEAVIAGEQLDVFLADDLLKKDDQIREYFSNPLGVFPSPRFKDASRPAILYKKEKNVYFVRYFSCKMHNRKIENLVLEDF